MVDKWKNAISGTTVSLIGKRTMAMGKMAKPKRKLTPAERKERRERKANYMTIFIYGKQKRVPRPPTIDGIPVDEFIARNADDIWLHQEGLCELISENEISKNDLKDRPDSPF